MAEIYGTNGADVVTVSNGDTYHGMAGNDTITLKGWCTAQGEEGNDTLIGDPSNPLGPTVWYWSSREAINVDLQAGYAMDGLGGRDTLIDIHTVHGFKRNGDQGYGTAQADQFWLGPWSGDTGTIVIDGRGGSDKVQFNGQDTDRQGGLVLKVSADGRLVTANMANNPGFVFQLRNIESIELWYEAGSRTTIISDLIDLGQAGQETLLRGAKGWQKGGLGSPVALTYSFLLAAPPTGAEGGTGFSALNATQQQRVREVLGQLGQQTGLQFTEVTGDQGQLRFGINQQTNTRAYAFSPDDVPKDDKAGDVWLDVETAALLNPGQEGYYALLHELGHALGLRHPLPASDTSGQTVLLDQFANFANTLMLDVQSTQLAGASWPQWYGAFDLQALRYLYGSQAWNTGNNNYTLTASQAQSGVTLLDEGGSDTLDLSALAGSATLDLRPGKTSSAGVNSDGLSLRNNIATGVGTYIENAMLTRGDDVAIGNQMANVFYSMGGNDVIDGQDGLDTVVLPGKRQVWTVSPSASLAGIWNAEGVNGDLASVELQSIEKLRFDDRAIDLRTAEGQSANLVARVLGAVFGRQAVSNAEYAGIGLYFVDQLAYRSDALMQLALNARIGANASHAQVVDLLYTNVVGQAPTAQARAEYVDMLDSGSVSVAALGLMAANTGLNANNINLVGLARTGLDYLPYPS